MEVGRHPEALGRVDTPPATESRQRGVARVTFVDEGATRGARPTVDVLVVAPDREVGVRVVQRDDDVADRVREIPAGDGADGPGERRHGGTSRSSPVR